MSTYVLSHCLNFPFSCKLTEIQDACSVFSWGSAMSYKVKVKWNIHILMPEFWKMKDYLCEKQFDHLISKAHFLLIVCQFRCLVLGLWGWYEILTKKSSWLKCVEMFWQRFTVLALAYPWKCSGLSVVSLFRGIWSMRKPRDAGNAEGVSMLPVFVFLWVSSLAVLHAHAKSAYWSPYSSVSWKM